MIPLTKKEEIISLGYLQKLRQYDIATEIYPIGHRLQKGFSYANKKHIPWVIIIGEEEVRKSIFSLKHMPTGKQQICTFEELIQFVKTKSLP